VTENPTKSMNYQVIFMPSGRRGQIQHGETLLDGAQKIGVALESICNGRQTCGKCKIRVESGYFDKHGIHSAITHLSPLTEKEQQTLSKTGANGQRLACAACVHGDLLITVPEESRAQKQIIRKAETQRVIAVNAAIRQVYIEVEQPELGDPVGDWGRVQTALSEQWQLDNLEIDLHALQNLQSVLRKENWGVTITLWNQHEVIDVQPDYLEGAYGLAVDVGSTTIASYLCDLRTGELLASQAMMNPQVSYGEDLMSRISFTMNRKDGLNLMHSAVIDALNQLAKRAAREAGIRARQIHEAVFVGNTVMTHILLGLDPLELGGAPFALARRDSMDIKARDLGLYLHPGANIHILPAEAGHVGADNVAVLIAEQPYEHPEITLLIDVGTNAEIVLSTPKGLYSASSPTGPAFEGGQISSGMRAAPGAIERVRIDPESKKARFSVIGDQKWSDQWQLTDDIPPDEQPANLAAGICGSGIIEVIAELFIAGILLPDGRFNPEEKNERMVWNGHQGAYILATEEQTSTGEKILITQEDVRNIQLAKAALYAGAKLLMMHAKVINLDKIILAGAFGSYIDPKHALVIGLIPDCKLSNIHAVGNAAGDGARIALLNRHKRKEAQEIAHRVNYIETAVDPDFQDEFVKAMHLPHSSDEFEHLADILPKSTTVQAPRRRTRRHSRNIND